MTPLHSLADLSPTLSACGEALVARSSRSAPSAQRIQDWLSGRRTVPDWAQTAAATALCALWMAERNAIDDASLPRCDARWAALVDPVLGCLYDALATMPETVAVHLAPLRQAIRRSVEDRYAVTLPGV